MLWQKFVVVLSGRLHSTNTTLDHGYVSNTNTQLDEKLRGGNISTIAALTPRENETAVFPAAVEVGHAVDESNRYDPRHCHNASYMYMHKIKTTYRYRI